MFLTEDLIIMSCCIFFRFWEQVEPSVVELLQSQWAYKDDMEMFGYNVTTYLSDIGVILK